MKTLNILLMLIVLTQLLWVAVILLRHRRQKTIQNELVAAASGKPFWRIAISRPDHLKSFWKLSPIQSLGILMDDGNHIHLRGRWHKSGEIFERVLPKDKAHHPIWKGSSSIRGGAFFWAQISSAMGDLMITAGSNMQPQSSRETLSDILHSAFPGIELPMEAAQDFALEKNRCSVAAMVGMAVLFFFGILDTYVFNRYELIDAQIFALIRNPWAMAVAGTAIFSLIAVTYIFLRRGNVPTKESYTLSALVVVAVAVAVGPALKRIDQLSAVTPSSNYKYRVTDRVTNLEPVDGTVDLPLLRFKRAPEYWAQFPEGTEVDIPLLRGRLGLWQIDHDRFDEPIIQFYKKSGG